MVTSLYFYVILSFLIVLATAIYTIMKISRQYNRETVEDNKVNKAIVKHFFVLNPALIAYVLFPIIAAIGAYLLYQYLF